MNDYVKDKLTTQVLIWDGKKLQFTDISIYEKDKIQQKRKEKLSKIDAESKNR